MLRVSSILHLESIWRASTPTIAEDDDWPPTDPVTQDDEAPLEATEGQPVGDTDEAGVQERADHVGVTVRRSLEAEGSCSHAIVSSPVDSGHASFTTSKEMVATKVQLSEEEQEEEEKQEEEQHGPNIHDSSNNNATMQGTEASLLQLPAKLAAAADQVKRQMITSLPETLRAPPTPPPHDYHENDLENDQNAPKTTNHASNALPKRRYSFLGRSSPPTSVYSFVFPPSPTSMINGANRALRRESSRLNLKRKSFSKKVKRAASSIKLNVQQAMTA